MKELLGEELYTQVKEKIGDKEIILNDGSYIPKSKFDTLNETKKGLETQLKEVNDKVSDLSKVDAKELQKTIDEMNTKYDTDTKEWATKLEKAEYNYKIKELTSDMKFSSNSAKKSFIKDLEEKGLKFEDGKILGFDDFVSVYKESDPEAFKVEETTNTKTVDFGKNHENGTLVDEPKTLAEALRQKF